MAQITEPQITTVTVTPNPVNAKGVFTIQVGVTEVPLTVYRATPRAGSFASGQSVKLAVQTEVES